MLLYGIVAYIQGIWVRYIVIHSEISCISNASKLIPGLFQKELDLKVKYIKGRVPC